MKSQESLRQIIENLEIGRQREAALRKESEILLEGLQLLNQMRNPRELFQSFLETLKKVLDFDHAFVLNLKSSGDFIPGRFSPEKFRHTTWRWSNFFERVIRGSTISVFDIEQIPEWREQPESVRSGITSALHVPLSTLSHISMLVCTHRERGFFNHRHVQVARRFALLAAQVLANINHHKSIRDRNQQLENDLMTARHIQAALIGRRIPDFSGLQIGVRYRPLEAIGGDFYSFLPESNRLGIFIGDVSGHGIPAALFLSLLKFSTDRISQSCFNRPVAFMEELNLALTGNMHTNFVTAIYGFFEKTDAGIHFTFSRAGHPPPILIRREKNKVEYLHRGGRILGIFKELQAEENSIILAKGDRLYLYTDGLTEILGGTGEVLARNELDSIFERANQHDLELALDRIISWTGDFRGATPAQDDIILLGFEA